MRGAILALLAGASLGHAQGSWSDAQTKAKAAVAKLSQSEKIGMVTGVGWQKGPCVGNTGKADSVGFPSLCTQDSPLGVRFAQGVTAFPPGIMTASTWDRDLMNQRGTGLGEESKGLGVNVLLGPVAGPIGIIPEGGRGWEGFGPDPYLNGISMQQTVTGMQGAGAQACAKHFIGNERSTPPMAARTQEWTWPCQATTLGMASSFGETL